MGAEIPDGAVIVARAILNSSLWNMRPEDCKVAITCIALCNWKDGKWFDGQKDVTIKRGQFVRSWEHLAEACNLSVKITRTCIKHLENTGFLARKQAGRYSVYTIPKWEFYQDLAKYSDSADKTLGRSRAASGQQLGSERAGRGQRAGNKQEGVRTEDERRIKGMKGEEAPSDSRNDAIASLIATACSVAIWEFKEGQIQQRLEALVNQGFPVDYLKNVLVANRGKDVYKIDFGAEPPLERESVAERTFPEAQYVAFLKKLHKDDGLPMKRSGRGVYLRSPSGDWARNDDMSKQYFEEKKQEWNNHPDHLKLDLIKAQGIKSLPDGYVPPAGWSPS